MTKTSSPVKRATMPRHLYILSHTIPRTCTYCKPSWGLLVAIMNGELSTRHEVGEPAYPRLCVTRRLLVGLPREEAKSILCDHYCWVVSALSGRGNGALIYLVLFPASLLFSPLFRFLACIFLMSMYLCMNREAAGCRRVFGLAVDHGDRKSVV